MSLSYDSGVFLLAIDTCDSRGSIALVGEEVVVATVVHESEAPYSSWLFAETGKLVKSVGRDMSCIAAYGVASGPGSFTGLRVGLTAVKAWAEVYERPVIPVSRLEAVAVQSRSNSGCVAAFLDAHRGQVFGGLYRREGKEVTPVAQEMVGSPQEFVTDALSRSDGGNVRWVSPDANLLAGFPLGPGRTRLEVETACFPLAPIIGEIAIARLQKGIVTDALRLDADYVRRSDAEILWKGPSGGRKLR